MVTAISAPLGAGEPAPDVIARLYHRAFSDFGVRALGSRKPADWPTITQGLTVADALRVEGDLRGGLWPSRSRHCAVPLSDLQSEILRLLAAHRNPDS